MDRYWRRQRFTGRIAIFPILLVTFVPCFSHAFTAERWTGYLCETKRCSADANDDKDATADEFHNVPTQHGFHGAPVLDYHRLHFEHSQCCLTYAGSFVSPPALELIVPLVYRKTNFIHRRSRNFAGGRELTVPIFATCESHHLNS
jgi:hypothetical protein